VSKRAVVWMLVAIAIGVGLPVHAEVPGLDRFAGTWRYADHEQGEAVIAQGVNRAVDAMPFFFRPFARPRLESYTQPAQRIELEVRGDRLFMVTDDWGPVGSEVNGRATRVRGTQGEPLRLTQRFQNGRIVQRFAHDEGARTNTYALSGDGRTLWLNAELSSPRLPRSVAYRLRYQRG
jgi:hypothetical protein